MVNSTKGAVRQAAKSGIYAAAASLSVADIDFLNGECALYGATTFVKVLCETGEGEELYIAVPALHFEQLVKDILGTTVSLVLNGKRSSDCNIRFYWEEEIVEDMSGFYPVCTGAPEWK